MVDSVPRGIDRRAMVIHATGLMLSLPISGATGSDVEAVEPGKPDPDPGEIASWLKIDTEGRITVCFGKMDMGQGVDVAIAQIVAEELYADMSQVSVIMGDTALTCDQGGASGSTGVQSGIVFRNAAAEARRILIEWAAVELQTPVEQLRTASGTVFVNGDRGRAVSYGKLAESRHFRAKLKWNGKLGNGLRVEGFAPTKDRGSYSVIGQSVPRFDVPGKVSGASAFVTDIRLDGMRHGRMIRPPVAGAVPKEVDARSTNLIPGVDIVRRGGFLGVVADTEWHAIQAAEQLRVTWTDVRSPFPGSENIYDHIRAAPVAKRQIDIDVGDFEAAWTSAATQVEAEFEWPFQSHACMGPACAVADVRSDGARCWTASQKPHEVRAGIAALCNLPLDSVRATWVPGPGSYGRNDAGDAALDAAFLSQAVGKPVRVQGTRHEGHGWDPKGPASIHRARAAIDPAGNVIAYEFMSKGFSRHEVAPSERDPSDSLAGKFMGFPERMRHMFGTPMQRYQFANSRLGWETVAPLMRGASPLRGAHLRDPLGPQILFASESFMDELAASTKADPIEFRMRHLDDERAREVLRAASERARWKLRPTGDRGTGKDDVYVGRGVACAKRFNTYVATIADVEVNTKTGAVWARRFTVAHDCGLIVNPGALKLCLEGNVVQGISRTLCEEVKFDEKSVTSVDWLTYPILEIGGAPEAIDVVLIDRPEIDPSGAGEATIGTIPAAIGNAIFDATGVRVRRAPITPERLLASLAKNSDIQERVRRR